MIGSTHTGSKEPFSQSSLRESRLPCSWPVCSHWNTSNPHCGELTVVSIGADRQLYVNCRAIREDELAARVTESLERNKGKAVLLKADEAAPYSAIMAAMARVPNLYSEHSVLPIVRAHYNRRTRVSRAVPCGCASHLR